MSHQEECGCSECSPKDVKHAADCGCSVCTPTDHATECSCSECAPKPVTHDEYCGCTECSTTEQAKPTLTIETEEKSGKITLKLKGSLDTVSAAGQGDAIVATLDKGSTVVLDMDGVYFLSSAGIRVLIMAAKKAKSANKTFQLTNLQSQIKKVLEMSGMLKVIPVI